MTIIEWLESKGIDYITRGKNVQSGCVAIQCPLCEDRSKHCNLSLSSPFVLCFRCGKHSLAWLIKNSEDISYKEAKDIVNGLEFDESLIKKIDREEESNRKLLPGLDLLKMFRTEFSESLSPMQKEYLEKRGFDPEYLKYKYRILGSGYLGDYKYRVIFPIIMGGKTVSFVGRDVTGLAELRYKNLDESKVLIPRYRQLYNIDYVREDLVVTEGVTDVCKFGDGAVATLSISYTPAQIVEIVTATLNRNIKRCFVIYDPGEIAQQRAKEIATQLALLGRYEEVKRVDLGDTDLGGLSEKDVSVLKKELFRQIF